MGLSVQAMWSKWDRDDDPVVFGGLARRRAWAYSTQAFGPIDPALFAAVFYFEMCGSRGFLGAGHFAPGSHFFPFLKAFYSKIDMASVLLMIGTDSQHAAGYERSV